MKKGGADDAEARARMRHHSLIQDYLDFQKEFVMKKKKKQERLKQKRATLMAEVRHLHLLKIQAARRKMDDYRRLQSSTLPDDPHKLQSSTLAQIQDSSNGELGEYGWCHGRKQTLHTRPVPEPSSRSKKKPKTSSINGKGTMKKKKVSWQDQEAVKV